MANTAQPNQPLIEHPLPFFMRRALGAGSTLIKGALPNTDTLLIPPPGVDPNGVVARDVPTALSISIFNNSGIAILAAVGPAVNFSLVYKNASGHDTVLVADGSALGIGESLALSTNNQFVLDPTDQGVFLRLGDLQDAVGDFPGALDAFGEFIDIRDVTRVAVDLTTTYQNVLNGVQGKARFIGRGPFPGLGYLVIANFDTIAHAIETRLSDGVNVIQLPSITEAPVPIKTTSSPSLIASSPVALPTLLEGWSLQMRTTVAAATRPCRAILGFTDTNLAPVRTNQGGAF